MRSSTILFVVSAGITAVTAKTDLTGCTSTEVVAYGGASLLFWDPTDDEICSFLDCGGGTAPRKLIFPPVNLAPVGMCELCESGSSYSIYFHASTGHIAQMKSRIRIEVEIG